MEASNALNYRVWGIPAVLLRGIPGNALVSGVFPDFFRNFFRKVRAVLGVWPTTSTVLCVLAKAMKKCLSHVGYVSRYDMDGRGANHIEEESIP